MISEEILATGFMWQPYHGCTRLLIEKYKGAKNCQYKLFQSYYNLSFLSVCLFVRDLLHGFSTDLDQIERAPWLEPILHNQFGQGRVSVGTPLAVSYYVKHVRSFSLQFPIIRGRFRADLCPNQGGIDGQTNPQTSLVKLK